MWICLNDAFISAVLDPREPGKLKVRARNIEHLQTLFPGEKIITTKDSDYRHRVIITKEQLEKVLVERLRGIDYDNFKSSVKDDELHKVYADFWHVHYRYQVRLQERQRAVVRTKVSRNPAYRARQNAD